MLCVVTRPAVVVEGDAEVIGRRGDGSSRDEGRGDPRGQVLLHLYSQQRQAVGRTKHGGGGGALSGKLHIEAEEIKL